MRSVSEVCSDLRRALSYLFACFSGKLLLSLIFSLFFSKHYQTLLTINISIVFESTHVLVFPHTLLQISQFPWGEHQSSHVLMDSLLWTSSLPVQNFCATALKLVSWSYTPALQGCWVVAVAFGLLNWPLPEWNLHSISEPG